MSGNPWWRDFRGCCPLALPSPHLERRRMSPSDHRLLGGNSLAQYEEGMVCEITVYHGRRRLLWCSPRAGDGEGAWVQSHPLTGSHSRSQAWHLDFQSHRADSNIMSQDIGFQENVWYIALFTIASVPLCKHKHAVFLSSEEPWVS